VLPSSSQHTVNNLPATAESVNARHPIDQQALKSFRDDKIGIPNRFGDDDRPIRITFSPFQESQPRSSSPLRNQNALPIDHTPTHHAQQDGTLSAINFVLDKHERLTDTSETRILPDLRMPMEVQEMIARKESVLTGGFMDGQPYYTYDNCLSWRYKGVYFRIYEHKNRTISFNCKADVEGPDGLKHLMAVSDSARRLVEKSNAAALADMAEMKGYRTQIKRMHMLQARGTLKVCRKYCHNIPLYRIAENDKMNLEAKRFGRWLVRSNFLRESDDKLRKEYEALYRNIDNVAHQAARYLQFSIGPGRRYAKSGFRDRKNVGALFKADEKIHWLEYEKLVCEDDKRALGWSVSTPWWSTDTTELEELAFELGRPIMYVAMYLVADQIHQFNKSPDFDHAKIIERILQVCNQDKVREVTFPALLKGIKNILERRLSGFQKATEIKKLEFTTPKDTIREDESTHWKSAIRTSIGKGMKHPAIRKYKPDWLGRGFSKPRAAYKYDHEYATNEKKKKAPSSKKTEIS